jgi:hypothetical protein
VGFIKPPAPDAGRSRGRRSRRRATRPSSWRRCRGWESLRGSAAAKLYDTLHGTHKTPGSSVKPTADHRNRDLVVRARLWRIRNTFQQIKSLSSRSRMAAYVLMRSTARVGQAASAPARPSNAHPGPGIAFAPPSSLPPTMPRTICRGVYGSINPLPPVNSSPISTPHAHPPLPPAHVCVPMGRQVARRQTSRATVVVAAVAPPWRIGWRRNHATTRLHRRRTEPGSVPRAAWHMPARAGPACPTP